MPVAARGARLVVVAPPVLLALLTLTEACRFDPTVAVKPLPQITCGDDTDCPPELRCEPALRRCVPVRADVDVTAPGIGELAFVPAFARADTDVRLTLVADEDLRGTPALTFDGAAPTLVLEDDGPQRFSWTVAHDAFGPDTSYRLARVDLEDQAGNAAQHDVDTRLVVDRTRPALTELVLDRATYSFVPPFDVVRATVKTGEALDEPPASFTLLFDDTSFGCDPYDADADGYACRLSLLPAFVEGEGHIVQAVAADVAGNLSILSTGARVDATAPVVTGASLLVQTSGGASANGALTLAGRAVITIDADEPVSAARVSAIGPGFIDFDVALDARGADAARVVATYTMTEPLPLGAYDVTVALTDLVGNESDAVVVPLAPPGLVVADGVDSPCLALGDDGAPACTDFDDDGFFGRSSACAGGNDCHDDDPLVHPGALDLPGDAGDDHCGGGAGLLADESTGVFMAPDGSDTNFGTRDAPVASLPRAFELIEDGRPAVFVRAGDYPPAGRRAERTLLDDAIVVVGGFDAGWRRSADRTTIELHCEPDNALVGAGPALILDDVDLLAPVCDNLIETPSLTMRNASLLVDCPDGGCYMHVSDSVLLSRSVLRGATLGSLASLHLVDSRLEPDFGLDVADIVAVRSFIDSHGTQTYTSFTLVSSVMYSDALDTIGDVTLLGATLTTYGINDVGGAGTVRIVDSIVETEGVGLREAADSTTLLGNALHTPCFYDEGDLCLARTADEIDACAWTGCTLAAQNVVTAAELDADGVHLSASDALPPGVPSLGTFATARAGDIDKQCRDLTAPDRGADER